MDERTRVLVCIGASTGANCMPCFEYYFKKANDAGLTRADIQEAVDMGMQVKSGARMSLKNFINDCLGEEREYSLPCSADAQSACCG